MRKLLLSFIFLASITSSHAQRMMGIATSNWCGTNSITLNPASIADSRTRFSLDLFSLNFGIDNNLASVDFSKALGSTDGVPQMGDIFTFSKNKAFNVLLPVADIHLPGIM